MKPDIVGVSHIVSDSRKSGQPLNSHDPSVLTIYGVRRPVIVYSDIAVAMKRSCEMSFSMLQSAASTSRSTIALAAKFLP